MLNIDFFENESEYNITQMITNKIFLNPVFIGDLISSDEYQYYLSICDTYVHEYLLLLSQEQKYQNNKIKILNKLRSLLDNDYNLVDRNNRIVKCFPTRLSFKNDIVDPTAIETYSDIKTHSIEKHLIHFYNWIQKHTSIKTKSIVSNKKGYTNRYVSYLDWIITSLYFIYFDGRDFDKIDNNDKYIPRFKRKYSCSQFSYKLALKKTLSLFNEIVPKAYENEDFKFIMVQLYKIDNEFKFFKVNRMCFQRENFLLDPNIEEIIDLFPMKPTEAIELKNIFDEQIFKNKEFIDVCINSSCRDPFQVFISVFKEAIIYIHKRLQYDNDFKLPQGTKIKNLIIAIKFKCIDLLSEDDIAQLNSNLSLDINKINLYFWKEYYFSNRKCLKNYSLAKTNDENDYMSYLFSKVIASLPKYEKHAK